MSISEWVFNNKVKIWTESFGKKGNPAVLLIIGAGAVSAFYPDDFCQKIADENFFVIRYDQRDYGKSTHFKQINSEDLIDIKKLERILPYRLEHLIEDARIILDTYGILKTHIVGHSMGGVIVQLFTVIHPERLLSFTSISVGPVSQRFELESVSEEIMELLLSNQPTGSLENDLDGWLTSFKLLNGKVEFDEAKAKKYVEEIYKRDPHPTVAWNHIGIQLLMPDYFEKFQKNTIPGLVLHGEDDVMQPVSYARLVHEMIKNTKLVVLPKAGHMFFNANVEKQIIDELLKHFKNEK